MTKSVYLPLFKPIIGHKMKLANKLLCLGTALLATLSASAQILPGEQAPPANPGQRNFGGFQTRNRERNRDTTGMAAMMRARMAEMNRVRTLTFDELSMSDPFIYPDPVTKTYYLTSSGGRMYKSKDLKTWEGPYNIIDIKGLWLERAGFAAAAEIHKIGDYYYYAGTWSDHSDLIQQVPRRYNVPHNQTYLLRSDKPEGPYTSFAVTPHHPGLRLSAPRLGLHRRYPV